MKKELTATIYIFNDSKDEVLLIHHRKLGKWLPPGGHIDQSEIPSDAAIREAKEETGLDVELIHQENLWVDKPNAVSIPRPFMCLLENIPAHNFEPAHQHIDQIFVGRPVGGELLPNQKEIAAMKWFSRSDLESLKPEVDIFSETLESLSVIMRWLAPQTL